MSFWCHFDNTWTHPNVRRIMTTQRITVRLPQTDLHSIDLFIRAGEFSSRSEVIRHAVNDFIKEYAQQVIEKANKMKKVQELEMAVEAMEPYMKK